jgi:PKD repeat protein
VIANNGLPRGLGAEYFIFTPSGVATCFDSTGLDCSAGGTNFDYCAYHSSFGSGSSTTLYAVMPYAYVSGCNSGQSPNGDPADSTINVTSHENIETITDPLGNAWFDSSGQEIGDKCAWNFGSALGGSPGAEYNEQISSGNYWMQQEWSNATSGCVQRMSSAGGGGPTAAFTFSPSVPRARQTVSFDGSTSTGTISRYSWTFGDGRTGSGQTTSHSYRRDGTYTVTLKVMDTGGRTSSVSHALTVSG